MKYLIVTVFVLAVFWLWRHNRQAAKKAAAPPVSPRRLPAVDVVACGHCGVHLPKTDALPGRHGHYCCDMHRGQAET